MLEMIKQKLKEDPNINEIAQIIDDCEYIRKYRIGSEYERNQVMISSYQKIAELVARTTEYR